MEPLVFSLTPSSPTLNSPRKPLPSHPTIRGRFQSTAPSASLSSFCTGENSDNESEPDPVPSDQPSSPRRKRKRPHRSRIARPKDSMPYLRRRHHRTHRTKHALPSITAAHLDRSTVAPSYKMTEDLEELMQGEMNVRCDGHDEECIRLVCKRGENQGRPFWKCAKRGYQQCEFFQWADLTIVDSDGEEDGKNGEKVIAPAVVDVENVEELLPVLKEHFGYASFRDGQEETLANLFDDKSTLTLLPTGTGKSLIYQLYAMTQPGLVIVVTPLIALMNDQLSTLPPCLSGASLRVGMGAEMMRETEQRVRNGEIKVLFVTPERLFTQRFGQLMKNVHTALVVVDEAHCLSQWSHNFRTAYLRLPHALDTIFDEWPNVLALTATATKRTVQDVKERLRIDKVVQKGSQRKLRLTLSCVEGGLEGKAYELVRRLREEPFGSILGLGGEEQQVCKKRRVNDENVGWGRGISVSKRVRGPMAKHEGSIIVYVGKQRDCESVANYLQSSTLGCSVGMYHAGMGTKDRQKVQERFEKGATAILVATVAFGLGVDYKHVQGVVHFDMPSSLEGYMQEVGRAGREGEGVCHAFFSEADGCRLVSRSRADGVDLVTIRQLLRKMAADGFEHCKGGGMVLSAGEGDLKGLDVKFETAETVCAIVEMRLSGVCVLNPSHRKIRVKFFSQTPEELIDSERVAREDKDMVREILKWAKESSGQYDVVLGNMGVLERDVIRSLKRLEKARHISYEGMERGVFMKCEKEVFEKLERGLEKLASDVHGDLVKIERIREAKAKSVIRTFSSADGRLSDVEQSAFLHRSLHKYFEVEEDSTCTEENMTEEVLDETEEKRLRQACKNVLGENGFGWMQPQTARQVARILHGIDSAGFRAKDWWRCGHWGKFVNIDFDTVMRTARGIIRQRNVPKQKIT